MDHGPSDIPAEGPFVRLEPATGEHLMYLDRQLVGVARTAEEANATLTTLMDEIARETAIDTADMEADAAVLREELGLEPDSCWWEVAA